ncbi:lipopolysaccharide biosynthesis protein [Marinobacter subterrani]|uniref:lipopolysaccharide biosynthesis protein n=1 Tax=Marinobacter subterrani TaxID=1658765 RepID=UPI0023574A72|nr:lipopolysaccharide biosynthesis protein [Marinobacter subterrani]
MNGTEQRAQPHYDDEISLVDLATTFIRRRQVFYGVFAGVVAIALLYALLIVGEVREYSTLVQLGEQPSEDGSKPLEPPESVIASIESYWYPALQGQYQQMEDEKLPFKISATNPESTNLIKLTSEASPERAETVETYHQKLVDSINQRQTELLSRQKRELEQRVASLRESLNELAKIEATAEAQAQLIQERTRMLSEIEAITARINNLRPSETLTVARENLENKGTSKVLILALAVVLGLMLGVFAAFMAEFGAQVRRALKAEG